MVLFSHIASTHWPTVFISRWYSFVAWQTAGGGFSPQDSL
jgi:hypothetical protein